MPECNLKNEVCGFRCTGYDGKEVWKELHNLPKKIDCESCSEHADSLFKGLHDSVNVGLGKKPFDAKNYKKFVDEVQCGYNSCVAKGNCK